MNEPITFLSHLNEVFRETEFSDLPRKILTLCNSLTKAKCGVLIPFVNHDKEWVISVGDGFEFLISHIEENQELWTVFIEREIQHGGGWYEFSGNDPDWELLFFTNQVRINTIYSYPVEVNHQLEGVVFFIDPEEGIEWCKIIVDRLFDHLSIVSQLNNAKKRSNQLEQLIELLGKISSTLDRDQILNIIIEQAQKVLNSEAVSLFLVDEKTKENILIFSSNRSQLGEELIRVPYGEGIIGHVIKTGETIIVNDASKDERHYDKVDKVSGMKTKTLLAVPLQSRTLVLGGERGVKEGKIIGGLEAMNKLEGLYNQEDARLLEALAREAATVLEIAHLYNEVNQLVVSVIKALTAAIDAKDPYTQGHSQRVSKISQSIAKELGLSQDLIYHIQIGCLLHDVGKIGIPDTIIGKPSQLTPAEYEIIKAHPSIGVKILTEVRMPSIEMNAVAEHHERPDGSGYPSGLTAGQISLAGKIVAVADVFDAMTSRRPYRDALQAEEVLSYLKENIERKFDPLVIEALEHAYYAGIIKTQKDEEAFGEF